MFSSSMRTPKQFSSSPEVTQATVFEGFIPQFLGKRSPWSKILAGQRNPNGFRGRQLSGFADSSVFVWWLRSSLTIWLDAMK